MTHLLLFLHGTSGLRNQIGSCTLLQFSTVMVYLSSVSYWYMLHLCLFRLPFSRFCGNKLACPTLCWFFQANMSTEAGHSSEIAASEYTANGLPADENTPLVREANSTSRLHRICEQFSLIGFFLLFLSAEVVLIITHLSLILAKHSSENSTNTSVSQINFDKELSKGISRAIYLNVVEIVNCCLFLRIVAKSPSFVGSSRVLKDLCRLSNFWTLILFFLLYLMGASLSIYSYSLCMTNECGDLTKSTTVKILLQITLEILNFLFMMILVVFLNHTKLRHTIPGRAYILLKGALILFCFRFFFMVVSNTIRFIFAPDANEGVIRAKKISEILLLPFLKKIIELLWEKIFFDEKRIIGKTRRNRDRNQITFVL